MPVTIYDIAQRCHCSTATVSKAFNNTGNISDSKRKEIFKVANELNYVPNTSAKSLASEGHSAKLIAVLLYIQEEKSITHELFSSILNSFRIEMEKVGFDICFMGKLEEDSPISYLSKIKSRGCDGVFALSVDREDKKIQELAKSNIPLIAFDNDMFKHYVTSDNKEAIAKMVDHLVKMGHRDIAYIKCANYGVTKDRYDGFIEGLKRNHIPFNEKMVAKGTYFNTDSARVDTDNALNNGFNPSVIMYPDDYTAISAITYLKKLGYSVPKDISVTGFDGIELMTLLKKPIATVCQDTVELGKQAALNLYAQIRGQKCAERVVVKTKLDYGKSIMEKGEIR